MRTLSTLIFLPALLSAHMTLADDMWTRDKLTGDWGGLRSDLTKHGIDIDLRLTQYYQEVTSGGRNENGEYGGTLDYRIKLEGDKLFGSWEGFWIDMHARTRWGDDIGDDAGSLTIPNTGLLMPLPGDYSDTDITGLTVNQMFPVGDTHLGLATAGKLDILDAVTLFFPSVGYGQEGFQNVNGLVSALPWFGAVNGLSLYGGWLSTINKQYGTGQSAVLVTGTENVTTTWGQVSESFDDVWVAAFHRFLYDIDGRPGYVMVFGGASTREQTSNDSNDFIFLPGQGIVSTEEEKPWDVALYVSQVLWQAEGDPSRKTTLLIGGTAGPDNPQFAQYNALAAVEMYGLFESRPHDRMGVSGWYNAMSDNFTDLVSPVADLRDSWGFEFYYNYQVMPSVHLTGDIQFLENEWNGDDLAVVPGVRLVIDF
ncbi:MAG: carbohydrate porin [Halioglobus sp.]